MNWKIVYEKDGKHDYIWFGNMVDEDERDRRILVWADMGLNIVGCYKVNGIV